MAPNSVLSHAIGNIESVKQMNSAMVYRTIALLGPISRIQIAEKCQLAPASITKITRQFLQAGLIKEMAQQNSTGGRPAVSIAAENTLFQTVAVQLSRNNITLELYNLAGDALAFHQMPSQGDDQNALESFLMTQIAHFIEQHHDKITRLLAISVVSPGLIDSRRGVINYMPHMSINQWELGDALKSRFHLPCFVGHDIRALALAEHYFGATQDCSDSILIRIHRGVGTGIIIHHDVFLGQNHYAGEIGHIQIDPMGERCHCGNFGCLESIVSNEKLQLRAKTLLTQGRQSRLTPEKCRVTDICDAANANDPFAIELIQTTAYQLAKVIAVMLNILNPQKVVLAGDITHAENVLFPSIRAALSHQTLKNIDESTELERSHLAHRSAIGAFALVKRAMFNGELIRELLAENSE